ncbi:hypothetical protein DWQ65_10255 [Treponema phagedenis]|nr:hypothetical protein DWQ65_10255 [Treponema phagedenis]
MFFVYIFQFYKALVYFSQGLRMNKGRCPLDPGLQLLLTQGFFGLCFACRGIAAPLHQRNVNFRTGIDARGSTQTGIILPRTAKLCLRYIDIDPQIILCCAYDFLK